MQKINDNEINEKESSIDLYILFFPLMLLYLELVLHLLIYKNIGQVSVFIVLFSITIGIILASLTRLFERKFNLILTWFFTVLSCFLFMTQYVYYNIFTVYLSLYSVTVVGTDAL